MKISKLHWLIPVFLIQITGTGYTIGEQFYIQRQGEDYLFQTQPLDPRDPFRGQYVALNFELEKRYPFAECRHQAGSYQYDKLYASLTQKQNGIAQITTISTLKPANPNYLTITEHWCNQDGELSINLPFDRYYANENEAYQLEQRARKNPKQTFLKVSVYKGKYSVEALLFSQP